MKYRIIADNLGDDDSLEAVKTKYAAGIGRKEDIVACGCYEKSPERDEGGAALQKFEAAKAALALACFGIELPIR